MKCCLVCKPSILRSNTAANTFEHSSILFEIYEPNTEQDYDERQLKEAFLCTL